MIRSAETFARSAHAGQFRKGAARLPYDTHLAEVADFVTRHGGDPAAVAAAWLHDTVEDTEVSFADLEAKFGAEVTGLVRELTDDKALAKAERKRMQVVHAPGKSPKAALVKLGDKTSNVRSLRLNPPGWPPERIAAYVAWAAQVVGALPPQSEAALAEFRAAVALHD
ncbi:HD domain-containing protein [Seohaeicola nanhaiensis]|uniref:HD domain-containing protein n=1 Tax=Seohaeicola nanhaiensis TaxID=1387282 RepID=A0ABV9KN65_9RHOB